MSNRSSIVIAVAKGRILSDVGHTLIELGFPPVNELEQTRKLVFEHPKKPISLTIARPSDVATLVHHGGADMGVVGKDVIIEQEYENLIELDDLKISMCKMVLAKKKGYQLNSNKPIIVATKYPRTAKKYLYSRVKQIEIIKLHGSIELAPTIGLSDLIVDISASGQSLKTHNLEIQEVFYYSTARLIVNHSSYLTKREAIEKLRYNFRSDRINY